MPYTRKKKVKKATTKGRKNPVDVKSFIFASDLHGDMQDHDAVEALFKFTEEFKPDVKIFGGDLFDFSPLMRNADPADKRESMEADVEAGMSFLKTWNLTISCLVITMIDSGKPQKGTRLG